MSRWRWRARFEYDRVTLAGSIQEAKAALAQWLLKTFDPDELRSLLAAWPAGYPLLDTVASNTSPAQFVDAIVVRLDQHALLTVDLFVRLAEARAHRVDSLLAVAAGFESMAAAGDRLAVVARAIERARRDGSTRELLPCLRRIGAATPELAAELERMASGLTLARGSADAYQLDIRQAVAHADVVAATQLLIGYLGEHHGRAIALRQAELLPPVGDAQLPERILDQAEKYRALDRGAGPPASESLANRLQRIRGGEALGDVVFAGGEFGKTYRLGGVQTYRLRCAGLELKLGQLIGVVGPNGGGKSTLLQILAGRLAPDPGKRLRYPRLDPGEPSRGYVAWDVVHRQIHFVPQRLEPWRETIAHELSIHAVRCGLRGPANEEAVRYVCARLGLGEYLHYQWRQLSGGFQLKLELAKALLSPAELLILDEPLAPLDINAQLSFLEDLQHIACEQHGRRTVVLSSQHVWEVEQAADRILYLHEGEVQEGRPADTICFEITGLFTAAFTAAIKRLGTVHWTHFKHRSLLLEAGESDARELWDAVVTAARQHGAQLESVRDVTRSRIRDLRLQRPA